MRRICDIYKLVYLYFSAFFLGRLALFLWKKGFDSIKELESELNSPFELELFNFSE